MSSATPVVSLPEFRMAYNKDSHVSIGLVVAMLCVSAPLIMFAVHLKNIILPGGNWCTASYYPDDGGQERGYTATLYGERCMNFTPHTKTQTN